MGNILYSALYIEKHQIYYVDNNKAIVILFGDTFENMHYLYTIQQKGPNIGPVIEALFKKRIPVFKTSLKLHLLLLLERKYIKQLLSLCIL